MTVLTLTSSIFPVLKTCCCYVGHSTVAVSRGVPHHGHDDQAEAGPHHVVLHLPPEHDQTQHPPRTGRPFSKLINHTHLLQVQHMNVYVYNQEI